MHKSLKKLPALGRIKSNSSVCDNKEQFRLFFDEAPDAMFLVDPENKKIIEVNKSACLMLGLEYENIIGITQNKLHSPVNTEINDPGFNIHYDEAKIKGYTHPIENIVYHSNGTKIPVEILARLIDTGNKKLLMGTFRDISERKKSEESLKKYAEELKKLNNDKDLFISILAHDLKSPFHSLLGFSNLLNEHIYDYTLEKIEKQVKIINNSALNFYNLLEDLLQWTNAQSGKLVFEPKPFNLNLLCCEVLTEINIIAQSKNIAITKSIDENYMISVDREMFKIIFRNLITNALKFTQKDGHIEIKAESNQSFFTFIISDNGIGMSSEFSNNLFDISMKHSRVGTAGENGTGLGLFLCKQFIEHHGGKIWVESQPQLGSRFYFTIPV